MKSTRTIYVLKVKHQGQEKFVHDLSPLMGTCFVNEIKDAKEYESPDLKSNRPLFDDLWQLNWPDRYPESSNRLTFAGYWLDEPPQLLKVQVSYEVLESTTVPGEKR